MPKRAAALAETTYERTDWEPSLCSRSRQGDRESPKMGQANSAPFRDVWYGPTERPDWKKEPTFDPMAGFPNGRKIRGNLMKKPYRVLEEIRIEDLFLFFIHHSFLRITRQADIFLLCMQIPRLHPSS